MASGDPYDLSGRAALVTGASSGLGRHFALLLARAGAQVAVAARHRERLAALTKGSLQNNRIAVPPSASWPGSTRPATEPPVPASATWIPGSRLGMTKEVK